MTPVRVGIVGLGFGAQVQLPVFRDLPHVEVRGLYSRDVEHARRYAAAVPGCAAFDDWHDLMASPEIDAVSIVTPPVMHRVMVEAALQNGKHVLCEKPFGVSASEAAAACDAARTRPHLVGAVDFEFRFEPGICGLRQAIADEMIGRVMRVDVSWLTAGRASAATRWSWQNDRAQGGGVANAFLSHVIDYTCWMTGSEFEEVRALTRIVHRSRIDSDGMKRQVTAEDACDVIGTLDSGAAVNIRVSNVCAFSGEHRVAVQGTHGRVEFEHAWPFDPAHARARIWSEGRTGEPLMSPRVNDAALPDSRCLPFRALASRFLESVRTGYAVPDLPIFGDGLRARTVLDRVAG